MITIVSVLIFISIALFNQLFPYFPSFMRTNRIMAWFTGNIGYHHIHHLNARIPFYRLPEVLKKIPELQTPKTTSLNPMEIIRCLRLKVWDVESQRMIIVSHL